MRRSGAKGSRVSAGPYSGCWHYSQTSHFPLGGCGGLRLSYCPPHIRVPFLSSSVTEDQTSSQSPFSWQSQHCSGQTSLCDISVDRSPSPLPLPRRVCQKLDDAASLSRAEGREAAHFLVHQTSPGISACLSLEELHTEWCHWMDWRSACCS